jgi:hypothetical protein
VVLDTNQILAAGSKWIDGDLLDLATDDARPSIANSPERVTVLGA